MNDSTDQKAADRKVALDTIKIFQANDWEIEEETPTYFLMKKNTASKTVHIVIAFFTIWWTFGIANLIYHFASKKKKKVII